MTGENIYYTKETFKNKTQTVGFHVRYNMYVDTIYTIYTITPYVSNKYTCTCICGNFETDKI